MNQFAMWGGYIVMAAGGLGLAGAAIAIAGEGLWRRWKACVNFNDLDEAVSEWRKAHPEKFAAWKKRNGISEG